MPKKTPIECKPFIKTPEKPHIEKKSSPLLANSNKAAPYVRSSPAPKIGILTYGSLTSDPGREIKEITQEDRTVQTPYNVEFTHYSQNKGDAPTLAPVDKDGARIKAHLLVLRGGISLSEAKNRLWRRETSQEGTSRTYDPEWAVTPNTVLVKDLRGFGGLDIVFYVDFPAVGKISHPNPTELAEKAIISARLVLDGQDGITYLLHAKESGIVTPLMGQYEQQILAMTETTNLCDALAKVQTGVRQIWI